MPKKKELAAREPPPLRVVELLGVPGAGKSTMCRNLIPELRRLGYHVQEMNDSILPAAASVQRFLTSAGSSSLKRGIMAYYLRSSRFLSDVGDFTRHNVELLERVAAELSGLEDQQDAAERWRMLLSLGARHVRLMQTAASDIVIVEEGFLQRGLTVFGDEYSEGLYDELNAYGRSIPAPDAVIVVNTPVADCRARLHRRGWPHRFLASSDSDRQVRLSQWERCANALATVARVDLGIPTIVVEGRKGTSVAASAPVARQLQEVLSIGGT